MELHDHECTGSLPPSSRPVASKRHPSSTDYNFQQNVRIIKKTVKDFVIVCCRMFSSSSLVKLIVFEKQKTGKTNKDITRAEKQSTEAAICDTILCTNNRLNQWFSNLSCKHPCPAHFVCLPCQTHPVQVMQSLLMS